MKADMIKCLKGCIEELDVNGDIQDCHYYINAMYSKGEIDPHTTMRLHVIMNKLEKYLEEYGEEVD